MPQKSRRRSRRRRRGGAQANPDGVYTVTTETRMIKGVNTPVKIHRLNGREFNIRMIDMGDKKLKFVKEFVDTPGEDIGEPLDLDDALLVYGASKEDLNLPTKP